jgi:hypothetical protein
MKLLKIGDTIINVDLVTDIRIEQRRILIFFAAPITTGAGPRWAYQGAAPDTVGARSLVFEDEAAATLRVWLRANAEDVLPP